MKDLKQHTDEQVVEYIRTQDQESYLELVLRYQNKLFRYVYTISRDEAKSEDIVQNTFIKAFVNLNNFNVNKKFSSWIFRIAHNQAIDELKKYKRETPILENIDFNSKENIEEEFSQKETRQRVQKCLFEMPLIYSEPLELYFIEEKSYDEISDILQIPIGTVGTRINRAKILMKKICQKIIK